VLSEEKLRKLTTSQQQNAETVERWPEVNVEYAAKQKLSSLRVLDFSTPCLINYYLNYIFLRIISRVRDPATRLDRRLNPDGTPQAWVYSRVDTAAYHHDLCYAKHKDTKTRNEVRDKKNAERTGRHSKSDAARKNQQGSCS